MSSDRAAPAPPAAAAPRPAPAPSGAGQPGAPSTAFPRGGQGAPGTPRPMAWQDRAGCRGRPLALFFGAEGERGEAVEARERRAKAVCGACPVRDECLSWALDNPKLAPDGIWGGMTEAERRKALGLRARPHRRAS